MTASYWPFLDLLREYFGWSPEEDEAARAGRLVAALRELVSRGDLSEARFDEIGPLLGHLFSLRFGNEWDERLKNAGPEEIKHRTFLALRDLFLALSRQQPVILVLEDLHWADSLSLDLISLLMETVTIAPLFLLCVYRPEREHKCWHLSTIAARKCAERYTEISLRELSAGQSRRLIESLLSIDNLPPSVKEAILQKSGGNPFFVEEVVRSLIASGMVYREAAPSSQLPAPSSDPSGREPETGSRALAEGVWKAREGIEKVTVPECIQSVILSRVDRLERELKRVLQSAAVIGRLFRRRLLEQTAREATALEQDLWELEEQALIYQERAVPEEEYSFQHVLTQETIYQNILRPRRAVFHQQVAEAMEALYQDALDEYVEQLAYHYERSGVDEKAVEYLLKAGEKARRAYLNEEAIGYFQRALARLDRSGLAAVHQEWRLAALKGLGQIYHGTGTVGEAEAHFRQAIALGKEIGLPAEELVRLYWWLGDSLFWQSRSAEMRLIAEDGLTPLGEDTESLAAALMNLQLARDHRNAEFVERLPYSEELRSVYTCIAETYAYGDRNVEQATHWVQALERQARQHHDLRALGCSQADMGWHVLAPSGDLRGAISRYQAALDVLNRIGDDKHASWCLMGIGDAYLTLGELRNAEPYAKQGLEGLERVGMRRDIARSHTTLGTLALCRGAWEEAADAFERAAQLFREIDWAGATAQATRARICLARGERREALQRFQEALAIQYPHAGTPRPRPTWGDWGANVFTSILGGLEDAYEDPEAFRVFCRRFREEHADVDSSPFVQWYLEPAQPNFGFRILDCGLPTSLDQIQNPKSKMEGGSGRVHWVTVLSRRRMAWRSRLRMDAISRSSI